ncbi:secreted antigen 1 [Babesia caballi]|uniref:Secreted antigen 1 n=1 Tax=Babesia caballi TaxID=5871 RepID=A0AAV4LM18_BABCB|nr:secreted antigen 1 [Babesia caballi]
MGNSGSIPTNPSTILQCIEVIVRLGKNNDPVVKCLEGKLITHFDCCEGTSTFPNNGVLKVVENITKTGEKLNKLLENVVYDYKRYWNDVGLSTHDYKEDYAVALAVSLCRVFPALLFLHYMTGAKTGSYHYNGQWSEKDCAWSKYTSGQDMLSWLYDYSGKYSHLLPRGFWHHYLQDVKGSEIFKHIPITDTDPLGTLQQAQFGLFLICPEWYDENTAGALVFLEELSEIFNSNHGNKDEFLKQLQHLYPQSSNEIQRVLQKSHPHLSTLIGKHQDQDRCHMAAIGRTRSNDYHGRLRHGNMKTYMDWLSTNLPYLIRALEDMKADCGNWSDKNFIDAGSNGPFSYGFVFKKSSWSSEIGKIKEHIGIVVDALNELHGILNPLHFMVYAGPIGTGAAIAGTLGYLHFTTPGGLGKFF